MRQSWILLAVMLGSTLLAACSTVPPSGIEPVRGFDLQRYRGKWYELARLDHRFERGLTNVTATYTPREDGRVDVLNRGYDPAAHKWKDAHGVARFNGEPDVGSLKVSFFGPFYGGYHVIALDPAYRWAMVAGNDRGYLWILARDKTLPDGVRQRLLDEANRLGFDTSKLVWVPQDRSDS